MSYVDDWFEMSHALGTAIKREQNARVGSAVNWPMIHKLVLESALFAGCVMLDKAGKLTNPRPTHINELYEVRNAIIHNRGDISLNRNSGAKVLVEDYINNSKHLQLNTDPDPTKKYITGCPFTISGNMVGVTDEILHFIKLLLI